MRSFAFSNFKFLATKMFIRNDCEVHAKHVRYSKMQLAWLGGTILLLGTKNMFRQYHMNAFVQIAASWLYKNLDASILIERMI